MQITNSFTRIYWLAWLTAFCCFATALAYYGLENTFGSFALISVLLGGLVFNFELGRLMGFLKLHAPALYSELTGLRWLELSVFFNPKILRVPEISSPLYRAMQIYRAAWRFSVVAIFLPLLINWLTKAYGF